MRCNSILEEFRKWTPNSAGACEKDVQWQRDLTMRKDLVVNVMTAVVMAEEKPPRTTRDVQ